MAKNAGRAINQELVLLYWDIGRSIVEKQQKADWGNSVVERLAADLRAEFPDMRGFSANNLWLMRQFYTEYSSDTILEQTVQELHSALVPANAPNQLSQAVRRGARRPAPQEEKLNGL